MIDLYQADALSEVDGRVRPGGTHPKDPLLLDVFQEIRSAPKPKSWEPQDAALATLTAIGEVRIAVSRAQASERKQRIETLAAHAGPVLRKVIRAHHTSTSEAGGI